MPYRNRPNALRYGPTTLRETDSPHTVPAARHDALMARETASAWERYEDEPQHEPMRRAGMWRDDA